MLATYRFGKGPAFDNDVTVTPSAVWFTDTINPVLYKLPIGKDGALPGKEGDQTLPITGASHYDTSASTVDGNGIAPTPDGRALIMIQDRTGLLFQLDPRTGSTTRSS